MLIALSFWRTDFLALGLARHNEGSTDITVLYKTFANEIPRRLASCSALGGWSPESE